MAGREMVLEGSCCESLSFDEFQEMDNMLRGVAGYYRGWYGNTYDDIYALAWEVALEHIKDGMTDRPWICRCVYNRISDLMRKIKREWAKGVYVSLEDYLNKFDFDPDMYEDYGSVPKKDPDFNDQFHTGEDFLDKENVLDILNLFEKDSNEWTYVALVAVYVGARACDRHRYEKLFDGNGSMDMQIARILGYNNSTCRGYRSIKLRVRQTVARYLGIGDRFNHKC